MSVLATGRLVVRHATPGHACAALARWMLVAQPLYGAAAVADADSALYAGPIIDVNVHALAVSVQGPPPVGVYVGEAPDTAIDASGPWPAALLERVKHPRCASPFWSPMTTEALRDRTLAESRRLNIRAIVSGSPELVSDYRARAPEHVIPALYFSEMTPTVRRPFGCAESRPASSRPKVGSGENPQAAAAVRTDREISGVCSHRERNADCHAISRTPCALPAGPPPMRATQSRGHTSDNSRSDAAAVTACSRTLVLKCKRVTL